MLFGFSLSLVLLERLPQVAHVFCRTQLWDASQQHEGEKCDQQTRVGAEGKVSLGTGVHEPLEVEAVATFDPAHDIQEVRCEDEGYTLPFHAKEMLLVSQDVAKVNVEKVPLICDHDVVVVPIAYTQDVSGHTVTSTGLYKLVYSLVVYFLEWTLRF